MSTVTSLQYSITIDLMATVVICSTVAVCFVLLYNVLLNILSWFQDIRVSHISVHDRALFHRSMVQYNAHLIDALERFVRDVDDHRGQRLRDSRKLPPLISYVRQQKRSSAWSSSHECVICLEDFEEGQSCQVFPICNHIFHSDCLDHWLKNRPTCPVCRNCILEV